MRCFRKIFASILLFLIFFNLNAFAEVVKKIEVTGNDRVSKETIVVFGDITIGKDYLSPNLKLLADDAMDLESQEKTKINLEQKLHTLIKTELSDLVRLSKLNFKNNYVRALSYQLFEIEKGGILK